MSLGDALRSVFPDVILKNKGDHFLVTVRGARYPDSLSFEKYLRHCCAKAGINNPRITIQSQQHAIVRIFNGTQP